MQTSFWKSHTSCPVKVTSFTNERLRITKTGSKGKKKRSKSYDVWRKAAQEARILLQCHISASHLKLCWVAWTNNISLITCHGRSDLLCGSDRQKCSYWGDPDKIVCSCYVRLRMDMWSNRVLPWTLKARPLLCRQMKQDQGNASRTVKKANGV